MEQVRSNQSLSNFTYGGVYNPNSLNYGLSLQRNNTPVSSPSGSSLDLSTPVSANALSDSLYQLSIHDMPSPLAQSVPSVPKPTSSSPLFSMNDISLPLLATSLVGGVTSSLFNNANVDSLSSWHANQAMSHDPSVRYNSNVIANEYSSKISAGQNLSNSLSFLGPLSLIGSTPFVTPAPSVGFGSS